MDLHAISGSAVPLQAVSPERANQQREASVFLDASLAASVTDKISQFNSLAVQSKQLERKTADAALKRAMLGREEAETEMRRYREEARSLRKQVDEGRDRERRVGERLETVMENYSRAKETHAHTQALWEKEIRRARKETFKSQSVIVKLQEELKAARSSVKSTEEALAHEKGRSQAREQEAFQARYALVGCQEELEQTLQQVKMLEQERDAFKTLAQSEEEVVKMAAEGRLPLPPPDMEEVQEEEKEEEMREPAPESPKSDSDEDEDDVGNSTLTAPKQSSAKRRVSSFSLVDIKSSAASEAEIDELTRQWQWEKQRADRASELVEYLEAECHLRACSCMRKRPRMSILESARKRPALDLSEAGGDQTVKSVASPTAKIRVGLAPMAKAIEEDNTESSQQKREPRRSTIFVPEEGVFRTVSQQIADEMEEATVAAETAAAVEPTAVVAEVVAEEPMDVAEEEELPVKPTVEEEEEQQQQPPASMHMDVFEEADITVGDTTVGDTTAGDTTVGDTTTDDTIVTTTAPVPIMYARTPSVEPPSFALLAQQRTSLLSLLEAPHRQEAEPPMMFHVPTTQGPEPSQQHAVGGDAEEEERRPASVFMSGSSTQDMEVEMTEAREMQDVCVQEESFPHERANMVTPQSQCHPQQNRQHHHNSVHLHQRSHTVGSLYAVQTTTVKVPLREETTDPSLAQRILAAQRTPTHKMMGSSVSSNSSTGSDGPSFDANNPALTPTMTREQCLAQIRERRGRARSAHAPRTAGSGSRSGSGSGSGTHSGNGSGNGSACAPRRPVTPGKERREVSAPVGRVASVRRVRS